MVFLLFILTLSRSLQINLDKANLFNSYFHSVFNHSSGSVNADELSDISNSLDNIIVSETEVFQALINLDPSKASGLDDIGPKILVSCASALCKPLHHLFNTSLRYGVVPEQWRIHS